MQILVQYSSEFVTAIGIFLATLLLIRFTSNRVKQLPEEEKSLGRPLWVASLGIFLLGVASLINYEYAVGYTELETIYYLVAIIGAGVLALAATMILGWRKGQALPFIIMGFTIVVALIEQTVGGLLGPWSGTFIAVMAGVLFGIPFVLFTYLTIKTKRITSFGFAVLALTYPFFLAMTSFTAPEIVATMLAVRLYGPALLITALILSETGITAELMIYAMTISSLFYFMSYLLVSPAITDIVLLATVSSIAIASVIGIGTAAYTITRWRKSRNQATLTLGTFFFIGGFSFLVVALVHVEFIAGTNSDYVALVLGIIAPMILNLSAIVALDWKRILLLPILIVAVPLTLVFVNWILGVPTDAIPMAAPVMAVTGIFQTVIPLALYGVLWWRMRKVGASGRSRALFLTVGIVFLILGTAGGSAVSLIPSLSILGAFSFWWLGVTGRADMLLGTATM